MSAGNGPPRSDSSLHVLRATGDRPVTTIGILDDTKPFTSFVNNKADKYNLDGLFSKIMFVGFFKFLNNRIYSYLNSQGLLCTL